MRILFCIFELTYDDYISVAYLSAIAKKRGHSTFFCELNDFENKLKEIHPDLVAYSLNIYGFKQIIEQHKKFKKKYNFKSIGGGPQVTTSPESFSETGIDVYCMGEGELAWDDYLDKLENNLPYDNIANLITPVAINPVRPWIKNLDDIPFPDRDLVLSNSFLKNTSKKTFYATRGCPFSCNYCVNNHYNKLYKGKGKIIRRFSPSRVIKEIEYVKSKYRTDFVKFGDDVFALKVDDWLIEFSKLYKKHINIPFNCYLRFDNISHELLKLLKECGCHSVKISVDSSSEYIRETILGRKMKKINIVDNLLLIHSFGIKTWVNFMLAVPESTLEDDLESLNIARKGKATYAAFSTTAPVKGTVLYDYSLSNNLINNSYVADMADCYEKSPFKCFTEKERNIRYNIYLLGSITAKLPTPLRQLAILIIKNIKPNKLFEKLQLIYETYARRNLIYKLKY